jgi:hypothetical protein
MKYLKTFGIAAVAAMAMTGFTASAASATILEWNGVTRHASVGISADLASGSFLVMTRTDRSFINTCAASWIQGTTVSPYSGSSVTAPVATMSYGECNRPVVVHKPGTLHITHIGGTNGTMSSSGAEATVGSPFGTLNCKTGSGVDLGTLTGVSSGSATLHVNAVVDCGFLVPSAKWEATYSLFGNGLGVSA